MLYDILIIDDDFGDNSDSKVPSDNANTLLTQLIRENLRVTWTTGELEDLGKLTKKDLSTIRYIFLDLQLFGFHPEKGYKNVNSKLIGIFSEIDSLIKCEDQVTCFINSKISQESYYDEAGKQDLEEGLRKNLYNRYTVESINTKNKLSDEQQDKLRKNNLQIYLKSVVINKSIKLEKIFEKMLHMNRELADSTPFERKFTDFKKKFILSTKEKMRIKLLQKIRNSVAHTDCDLSGITDSGMQEEFWEIVINIKKMSKPIQFENFDKLITYISSIDQLCETLLSVKKKNINES
ncbi:MAG: hypothetical protein ACR2N8_01855 [Parvibaculales bacterium]